MLQAVVEVAHLLHPIELLLSMHVHLTRAVHIRLIHDLDGSHIGIVTHIEREVHIVLQEEIHEAALLILRQLGEDKSLWLRLHHLDMVAVITCY